MVFTVKKASTQHENEIQATFVTQRNAPSNGILFFWGTATQVDRFPWIQALTQLGLRHSPQLRLRPTQAQLIIQDPKAPDRYFKGNVQGMGMDIGDAVELMGTCDFAHARVTPSASFVSWCLASQFALELIARKCFVPSLKSFRHELYGVWQMANENSEDIGRLSKLANAMPISAHCLLYAKNWNKPFNRYSPKKRRPPMMWHPEALLKAFLDAAIDGFMRKSMRRMVNSAEIQNTHFMLYDLYRNHGSLPIREFLKQNYHLDIDAAREALQNMDVEGYASSARSTSEDDADMDVDNDDMDALSEVYEDNDESLSDDDPDEDSKIPGIAVDAFEDESRGESPKTPSCSQATTDNVSTVRKMRYPIQPARLMPQKEYVFTTLCELEELPRWECRWFDSLVLPKEQSKIAYHVEDPDIIEPVQKWLEPLQEGKLSEVTQMQTGFWLEAPETGSADMMSNMWFLRYLLVGRDDPTFIVDAKSIFANNVEIFRKEKHAMIHPQEQLLADLGKAALLFEPIQESLKVAAPEGTYLDVHQAWAFISEISPTLLSMGFDVRLPEQLKLQGQHKIKARLRLKDALPTDFDADKSLFGLNKLASFQWEAAMGDDAISPEEFKAIVAMNQPLVQWRGEWILIDTNQLNDIKEMLFENASTGTLTQIDAMNRALSGVADPNHPDANVEIIVEGKLVDVLSKLSQEDIHEITMKAPPTFVGRLRPYQERGVAWLSYQERIGLGCCLADDMGLGKTIQLICHILNHMLYHPTDNRGFLLVCPMSVVGNWRHEFERFAPSLKVIVHHGAERAQSLEALQAQLTQPGTVVITTYGLITRSCDFMYSHVWSMIALDEAQAIKNATSKRAISIRQLNADFRVALTGTPIENRLSELWSILDFLNPGFLGTSANFQRLYATPIEKNNDKSAMERLKNLVSPFILRRVKTDPSIIQDLPEKMEHKVYCTLTREQATMYQALVDVTMKKIESATGIARHGQVLALLTHLKQIVDHPILFRKDDIITPSRSGKVTRLIEMLETVLENNEKALIFTQFKEMGDVLVRILEQELHLESIPFLHGSLSSSQRDELVARFQSPDGPPIFILSLKAGGTGLNLTAATHVFHFDRWWNPAVEEQATDRAFRIGQDKNVQVHKFLSIGSLEEKIDAMLEDKKGLSNAIVDNSGTWVTQLDTDALRELFTLNRDAVLDDVE